MAVSEIEQRTLSTAQTEPTSLIAGCSRAESPPDRHERRFGVQIDEPGAFAPQVGGPNQAAIEIAAQSQSGRRELEPARARAACALGKEGGDSDHDGYDDPEQDPQNPPAA